MKICLDRREGSKSLTEQQNQVNYYHPLVKKILDRYTSCASN